MLLAAVSGDSPNYTLPVLIAVATVVGVIITAVVNARIRANDRIHESAERAKDRKQERDEREHDRNQALEAVRLTLTDAARSREAQEGTDRDARLETYKIQAMMELVRFTRSAWAKANDLMYGAGASSVDVSYDFDTEIVDCVTRIRLLCRTAAVKSAAEATQAATMAFYEAARKYREQARANEPRAGVTLFLEFTNQRDQLNSSVFQLISAARQELRIDPPTDPSWPKM